MVPFGSLKESLFSENLLGYLKISPFLKLKGKQIWGKANNVISFKLRGGHQENKFLRLNNWHQEYSVINLYSMNNSEAFCKESAYKNNDQHENKKLPFLFLFKQIKNKKKHKVNQFNQNDWWQMTFG